MIAPVDQGAAALAEYLAGEGVTVDACRAEVLDAVTAERRVVAYTVHPGADGTAPREFVVKFFSDESGRASWAALAAVHAAHRGRCAVLRVPAPLGYDAARRLLLQQRVPGTALVRLADAPEGPAALAAAGRALAELHRLDLPAARPRVLADHVDELIRPHPAALCEAAPAYRGAIEAFLERARDPGPATWRATPLHRDYQLRQLFAAGPELWVIDWDSYAAGDPAFDVAYMLVYLRNHFEPARAGALCDAFRAGYLEQGEAGVMDRLAPYQSFNYLRRACRRWRLRDAAWEAAMQAMLRRFADSLETWA